MTTGMFLILCFLIVAFGHRSPVNKTWSEKLQITDKDYDPDWLKNYGKPETRIK
jgi:hypothetical protein